MTSHNPGPRLSWAALVIVPVIVALIGAYAIIRASQEGHRAGEAAAVATLQPALNAAGTQQAAPTQTPQIIEVTSPPVTVIVTSPPIVVTSPPVVITATPQPTPIPPENTPPTTTLKVGQTWKQDGAELTLESVRFDLEHVYLNWMFRNNANQDLLVHYFNENFSSQDNLGQQLTDVGFAGCTALDKIFKPGESFRSGDSNGCPLRMTVNLSNKKVTEVIVTVSNISRIEKAQWRIPVNLH